MEQEPNQTQNHHHYFKLISTDIDVTEKARLQVKLMNMNVENFLRSKLLDASVLKSYMSNYHNNEIKFYDKFLRRMDFNAKSLKPSTSTNHYYYVNGKHVITFKLDNKTDWFVSTGKTKATGDKQVTIFSCSYGKRETIFLLYDDVTDSLTFQMIDNKFLDIFLNK